MTDLPSGRPDPVATARSVVRDLFPQARQAWLAGSVTTGCATATSDLDVTVLLEDGTAHRRSLRYDGWPVELFVHTEASVRHFVGKDLARRRPTMPRLVATGVPLLAGDGGASLREECAAALAAGPGPLPEAELALARYGLTDLLDDLAGAGAGSGVEAAAVAVEVWRQAAELLLASAGRWSGTGKWLVREVEAHDAETGTAYAARLDRGLWAALAGDPVPLIAVADEVLAGVGGRLWEGYSASAPPLEG
jgi:hypothetical protein